MKKNLKRSIRVCVVLLVAALFVAVRMDERQRETEVRATYQEAEELIEQELYEEAGGLLEQISEKVYSGLETKELLALCQSHMSYDSNDITTAYSMVSSLELQNVSVEIQEKLEAYKEQVTTEYEVYLEEQAIAESEAEEQKKKEKEEQAAAKEKSFLESLSKKVPYVGMSETYISKTSLGEPSSTVRHNTEMISGQAYTANLYDFKSGNTTIFTARCVQGKVIRVWDNRDKVSSGNSSSSSGSSSKSSSSSKDEYNASDYDDPEEFYYDHYDDFDGYEDAEAYWEDVN